MYVIFALSTIWFIIVRLVIAALFIILQQLMLLLLAISLFPKVQLLQERGVFTLKRKKRVLFSC